MDYQNNFLLISYFLLLPATNVTGCHCIFQELISAAFGISLCTIDDPSQQKRLPGFLRGVAEEHKPVASPNFVVTQALVALMANREAKLRLSNHKDDEAKGLCNVFDGVFHSFFFCITKFGLVKAII